MVLLTITASIVGGLEKLGDATNGDDADSNNISTDREPSLAAPEVGSPISHGQIISLWRKLQARGHADFSLEGLLLGSRVYIPPPPPKPEPVRHLHLPFP